ncbi:ATP-grasp domain-containing protein [Hoyosella subflava]|uniref:ATP-grasp domain-containing protein n=1 Tax=Hoyosella subflava (strain DSM 45089 / JCM 17490 / NBRC 109087 / DQS3-9A1) TaxID=443218 RepID=F6EK14_HOYSD|nr:hypothetical protein [Hoyosella subflava]AEF41372.1 hypothetical protein AS9A_2925 [Hoyosella subflava DQS3-9A1]
MKVLVSAVRMPFSLAVIRCVGEAGHEVVATDSIPYAPGMHSHYVIADEVTVAPRDEPLRYIEEIKKIYEKHKIDLHVPTFEESFYLSRHKDELEKQVPVFVADFEPLRTLHSKQAFIELCERIGVKAPKTIIARDQDELREAAAEISEYCARPSFSRGALQLLTNTGPRAGNLLIDDCEPTAENPWLVQEYIEGEDLCSYSVAKNGKVGAHLTYEIPIKLDHAEGVRFITAEVPETLRSAQKIAAELGYSGHLSFDWKRLDDGSLCVIECNPRATNGASMMDANAMVSTIVDGAGDEPTVMPPGRIAQSDLGIVVEILTHQISWGRGLKALLKVRDLYAERGDLIPELYQFLQFGHNARIAHDKKVGMMEAMQGDTCWDGVPIP